MIESSDTQDPVEQTAIETASPIETAQDTDNTESAEKELSLQEEILARKEKPAGATALEQTAEAPVPPAFEPNFKYKAFGKEKELDELFRPLLKDAESEKKVKDVFTRADAFDDMKGRYESSSTEHQKVLQQYTSLDRDVKRVTKFLNNGDLDNFFSSVRVSDEMLFQHLQRKAELAKLPPQAQQAYQEGVSARAQQLVQQEQYEDLQSNYANQVTHARTMQLDMVLARSEVQSAASAWDQKMGLGQFRQMVIQEGANAWHQSKQDISAEEAADRVLKKFGKFLEAAPAPQAPVVPAGVQQAAPVAQPQVVAQPKPVIPNIKGRGTSPIKQAPKSLDDLRAMAKAARAAESASYDEQF